MLIKVSKNTMRLLRPTPVKYALPCAERREPSITNTPREAKPQRCQQGLDAGAQCPSLKGLKRLKSGAISAGYAQVMSSDTPSHSAHTYSHHSVPARSHQFERGQQQRAADAAAPAPGP